MPIEFAGSGKPLSQAGLGSSVARLQCDVASLWAVLSVETLGFGYLPDRRPKVLFERHIFSQRTGRVFDATNPDISNPAAGGYLGGTAEYDRLGRAIQLNRRAALESASWGLGQVMGFNATGLGYSDVEDMVSTFQTGEDAQLDGSVRYFVHNAPLQDALRARNWARVAYFYNGPGYAKNAYDVHLANGYALYSINGQAPSIRVRTAQAQLLYLNIDPHGVDGIIGPGTRRALVQFQNLNKLAGTADLDAPTEAALNAAVRF